MATPKKRRRAGVRRGAFRFLAFLVYNAPRVARLRVAFFCKGLQIAPKKRPTQIQTSQIEMSRTLTLTAPAAAIAEAPPPS